LTGSQGSGSGKERIEAGSLFPVKGANNRCRAVGEPARRERLWGAGALIGAQLCREPGIGSCQPAGRSYFRPNSRVRSEQSTGSRRTIVINLCGTQFNKYGQRHKWFIRPETQRVWPSSLIPRVAVRRRQVAGPAFRIATVRLLISVMACATEPKGPRKQEQRYMGSRNSLFSSNSARNESAEYSSRSVDDLTTRPLFHWVRARPFKTGREDAITNCRVQDKLAPEV
jgi:hypothetical protein